MKRVVCCIAAFVGMAGPAWADSATPAPVAQGREAWIGQCAARLERAREEAGKRDARFKKGSVEATGREASEAGDPTAKVAFDQVEFTLAQADSTLFMATVSTMPAEPNSLIRETWMPIPSMARQVAKLSLYAARAHAGLTGTIMVSGTKGEAVTVFDGAFRKAVDDCLAMKRVAGAGKGGGN